MSDIRKLHKIFKDQRRALLNSSNPEAAISDAYFRVSADFIPMLETLRVYNLNLIYKHARQLKIDESLLIPLKEISKKIDYEKFCNLGLYAR